MPDINCSLNSAYLAWFLSMARGLSGFVAKESWRFVCARFGVSYWLLVGLTVGVCAWEAFAGASLLVWIAGFATLLGWMVLGLRLMGLIAGLLSRRTEA